MKGGRLFLHVLGVAVLSFVFYKAITAATAKPTILAGIIPHHLLASELVTDLLTKVQAQHPETVYLLGPNHFEQGGAKLISDTQLVDWITVNPEVIRQEHALTPLVPMLRTILGVDVTIVPIALSMRCTREDIARLSDLLVGRSNAKTLVLASLDFSHYLSPLEAAKYDSQTWASIRALDQQRVWEYDNRFVDSSRVLTLMLDFAHKTASHPTLLAHTDASLIVNDPSLVNTTSYMTILFAR